MTDVSGPDGAAVVEHRHEQIRLSWTGLTRWEECRYKDHATRQRLGVPSRDGRIFLPGTVADLSMRRWLEGEDHTPGTLPSVVDEVLFEKVQEPEKPIVWKGGDKKADIRNIRDDVKTGLARLEPWLLENVIPHDYEPEARGRGLVGIPDLEGGINRVEMTVAVDIAVRRKDTGKFRLYDLKFTRDENYVRGKTLGQLTFYKIGWAAMLGCSLNDIEELAFLTPMTKQLEVPTVPSKDDIRSMMSRITTYAQGVWATEHPPKETPDSNCLYRCDVRRVCPLFTEVRGTGNKVSLVGTGKARKFLRSDSTEGPTT